MLEKNSILKILKSMNYKFAFLLLIMTSCMLRGQGNYEKFIIVDTIKTDFVVNKSYMKEIDTQSYTNMINNKVMVISGYIVRYRNMKRETIWGKGPVESFTGVESNFFYNNSLGPITDNYIVHVIPDLLPISSQRLLFSD